MKILLCQTNKHNRGLTARQYSRAKRDTQKRRYGIAGKMQGSKQSRRTAKRSLAAVAQTPVCARSDCVARDAPGARAVSLRALEYAGPGVEAHDTSAGSVLARLEGHQEAFSGVGAQQIPSATDTALLDALACADATIGALLAGKKRGRRARLVAGRAVWAWARALARAWVAVLARRCCWRGQRRRWRKEMDLLGYQCHT